jgi:hypothetical protein
MKKNNFQPVSNKELDSLLGKAFLDLDFEAPENDKMLDAVANNAMHKETITAFFNKRLFGLLLLLLSFFICLSSFASFMGYFDVYDTKGTIGSSVLPVAKPTVLNKIEKTPVPASSPAIKSIAENSAAIKNIVQSQKSNQLPVRKKNGHKNSAAEKVTLPLSDTSFSKKINTSDSLVTQIDPPRQDAAILPSSAKKSQGSLINSTARKQIAQQKRIKKVEPVKQNDRVRYAVRKKKLFRGKGSMKKGRGAGPFSWFKNKRVRGR